jgi:hypothetical protein
VDTSGTIPEDRWGKATTECKQSATVRKAKLSPSARAELAAAIRFVRHVPTLKFSWNARLILCMANVSDRPRTSVTPISSEPLPDNPQKRITAALVDFPPDAYSPEHHHEASLYVYALKGEIRSQPRMVTNEIMDKVVIAGTPTQVTDKLIELSEVGLRWHCFTKSSALIAQLPFVLWRRRFDRRSCADERTTVYAGLRMFEIR